MEDRFKFRFWDKNRQKMETYEHNLSSLGVILFSKNPDKIPMQCTGLKDKNGKLIYELDIVKTFIGNFIIRYCYICKSYQLFSVEEDYCFSCEGDLHWFEFLEDLDKTEIIGNIYQNPELLN